jgi:hypothetical protein
MADLPPALQPENNQAATEPERLLPEPGSFPPDSPWAAVGASVQGASHLETATPLQEAFACDLALPPYALVAVADGLGSAAQSRLGARTAGRRAVEFTSLALSGTPPSDGKGWFALLADAFKYARAGLEALADQGAVDINDYATTLLLAVLSPRLVATAQIGDGAIVTLGKDGLLETLSAPQVGEYANHTFPLTLPDAPQTAVYTLWDKEVKGLALFTDGLQRMCLKLPGWTPHAPFFEPLFKQLDTLKDPMAASRSLANFMASPRVCAQTRDDKTLILVGRR